MGCCNSDKGCSSSAPKEDTTTATNTNTNNARSSSRFSSGRSVDSMSNATPPLQEESISSVRGTSNVLAMLPAGKSCCAENATVNADCGNTGTGTASGNNNTNLNETSNVLVQYTLQDLDKRAQSNFWLGLLCLMVCSINVVLFYLNYIMHRAGPRPNVSHRDFHLLEFWTACVYSIAETFALVMSPKTMYHIYNKPNLLKLLLFFNVVNSAIPALLMTLDFDFFETLSHRLEFMNEFTLSFITMILLASLLNPPTLEDGMPPQSSSNNSDSEDRSSIAMGLLACVVAASNFFIYNAGYHAIAHYIEFFINFLFSLITFWFCMDNRFMAQMEIGQILYGRHQNCIFCLIRTNDLETQLQANSKYQNMFGTTITTTTTTTPSNHAADMSMGLRGALAPWDEYGQASGSFQQPQPQEQNYYNDDEELQATEHTPLMQS